jgi:hypothetical protein
MVKPLFEHLDNPHGLPNRATYSAPDTTVPDVQIGKAVVFTDAIQKKIRYGPFRLPPGSPMNKRDQFQDGLSEIYMEDVQKPCDECVILAVKANMEYADGTFADTSTGAYLHHFVLLNAGPEINEVNCGKASTESLFESGNERSLIPLSLGKNGPVKTGYKVSSPDKFVAVTRFQNGVNDEQFIWVSLTYEYYDKPQPSFKTSKMLWLNLGPDECDITRPNPFGASNLTVDRAPMYKVFEESSIPWTSPTEGIVIGTGAHLHYGGTYLHIYQNDKELCNSRAHYGDTKGEFAGNDRNSEAHIIAMDSCISLVPLNKGDTFHFKVEYNYTAYPGMGDQVKDSAAVAGVAGIVGILFAL